MRNLEPLDYDEVLRRQGHLMSTTSGRSMWPLLRDRRDAVHIARLSAAPRRGDVLLYRRANGECALHRVLANRDGFLSLRGDNQYGPPEIVSRDQALGVARAFHRKGQVIKADSAACRCFGLIWMAVYPFRRLLFRAWRLLSRRRAAH